MGYHRPTMTDDPDIDLRGQEPAPEIPPQPERPPAEPREYEDEVTEASDDSFPASDPPSFTDSSATRNPDRD